MRRFFLYRAARFAVVNHM